MLEHVMLWVQTYGYFALGGLLGLGIVGLPIPEETLLAYSGYLVAAGKLALPWTIAAGVVGSWVGVSVSYVIERSPLRTRHSRRTSSQPGLSRRTWGSVPSLPRCRYRRGPGLGP